MLNINISIEACHESDIELAIEEVLRLVRQGMTSGFNENETGNFEFTVEGEEEEASEDDEEEDDQD